MRRTRLLYLPAALAVVLSATACGGDPSTPDATGTTNGVGIIGTADPTTPAPGTSTTDSGGGGGGTAEDCVTYDAQVLLKNYAAGVHVVRPDHGSELLRVYGGPGDIVGEQALAVAKRFDTICYIGRGNALGSPEFVFEYWRDPSDFSDTPIPDSADDCVNYDPGDLEVTSLGGGLGWGVHDGDLDLQHFATEADAERGRDVLALADLVCYVENSSPSPDDDPADITYTFNSGD